VKELWGWLRGRRSEGGTGEPAFGGADPERTSGVSGAGARAAVVAANTAFALSLYAELAGGSERNLFFSPASISAALSMTSAGARGETAAEMTRVLRFALTPERLHAAFGELVAEMRIALGRELSVANALWAQKEYAFLPEFVALVRARYGAAFEEVDFRRDPEGARRAINAWVAEQTKDKIRSLIPPDALQPLTRLVLLNAVYFKGAWELRFPAGRTAARPFYRLNGGTVDTALMRQDAGAFRYLEDEGVQLLELPYAGGAMAMVVLLPKERDGLPGLEKALNAARLGQWLDDLARRRPREVIVDLPRMKIEASFQLDDMLRRLGMRRAFDERAADFSGMASDPLGLYLGAVLHKAFVEVNEVGTEAAAATAAVMVTRSAMIPERTPVFSADHPFVFLIRDTRSGSLLFLGRLVDPADPRSVTPPEGHA
jgi:serpin B